MKPYQPRPVRSHDLRHHEGWRLKVYSIVYEPGIYLEWTEYASGFALALAALPTPAMQADRPGVGFIVAHEGNTMSYLVLGWWDRENELPVRVFVREAQPGSAWRAATGGESFCVWDLQVLWFERQAYVDCVLNGDGTAGVESYLAQRLSVTI